MTDSLRLRLLAGTLAIVAALWGGLSYVAWREALHEADELFDAHLAQTAALLGTLAGGRGEEAGEIEEHLPLHHYGRKVAFQIWAPGQRLLLHSASAPDTPLSPLDTGFSDARSGGREWRVYGLRVPSMHHLIQVGEALDARRAVAHELAAHLLAPLAMALPLLALALVVLIRASLAPLSRLAHSIGQRSAERLEAIEIAGTPRELHPILEQLNALLARLGRSLDQERSFTADAAHELRTPLAAIRAHAQVALNDSTDSRQAAALRQVIAGTDRATHLVEQLLTLARLDDADALRRAPCDLRRLAMEALAWAAPQALDKGIELGLEDGPAAMVTGEATLLTVLLRNLIDNAVRYSPPESRVHVGIAVDDADNACVTITDQGPGIPAAERPRVLGRFYRVVGNSESGSGLGLSIAARIAELHAVRLELGDNPDGTGLCVRVYFPGRKDQSADASRSISMASP
jgi:two-component system sensor histidine kinase QseC